MADNASLIADMMAELTKSDGSGAITTADELKENQFGFPLRHYAQQYLFGSTGLRIQVFNSIAGKEATCKSPFIFDLMGHITAGEDHNGLDGMAYVFELEGKISPTLYASMIKSYGDTADRSSRVIRGKTLEGAFEMLNTKIIPAYKKLFPGNNVPLFIGFDSIGGAASGELVKKLETDGNVGKGFHEKTHHMKNFCENMGIYVQDIPIVLFMVNQEKDSLVQNQYGPPQKHITGGTSQLFKDGHMISAAQKTLASGDGKIITLRTTKTSFCDPRKIEVAFRWNKFGKSEDDYYGHYWDWPLASAKCLADPDKGVGEIRDICDVKVSDKNLVTSEKLGLRSVTPQEFEEALFAPENAEILNALYVYQKIDRLKGMEEYKAYLKQRKENLKEKDKKEEPVKVAKKPAKKKLVQLKNPVPKVEVKPMSLDTSLDEGEPEIV